MIILPTRAIDYLTKNLMPGMPFRLTVSKFQETDKTEQTTAEALHCLPELESKKLLLITPHSSDKGQIEIGLT